MENSFEVIDNFLDQEDFKKILWSILSKDFNWNFNPGITTSVEPGIHNCQFVHEFYSWYIKKYYQDVKSPHFDILLPIIEKIKPKSLIKIKANLRTAVDNIFIPDFHTDVFDDYDSTTSIFYLNTNNGYTLFEDGTKVESVANRIITFPAQTRHTGVNCTNDKVRVVINFNYF
tara:strand:- start:254 stop:772 length:519 start_codon:yes stop_codon:yes gene_type:complete